MDYYLQTPERFWNLNCDRPQTNLLHPFYPLEIIAFSPSWTLTWQRWNESRLTITTPNGVTLFFVYSHSKLVCLTCNATVAIKSKGISSGILKECKELIKGFSCQNLDVPQKFGIWKCSFNTAVSLHQNPEPREILFSIASVTSLLNTSSHLKMAVLWRKPFSRQQIAFLNTSKIEHRSWKPLKKWKSPALQGKRKNGYVCGGATEEVSRPVWMPFPHFGESLGYLLLSSI